MKATVPIAVNQVLIWETVDGANEFGFTPGSNNAKGAKCVCGGNSWLT
jgi:hypothetical protein